MGNVQEAIIKLTLQEAIDARLSNAAESIKRFTSGIQSSGQQMTQGLNATAATSGPVASSLNTIANAQGNLTAETQKTTSAIVQQHGGFLRFVQGITSGLLAYKLVSMAMNEIKKGFEAFAGAAIGFNAQLEQNRVAFTNLLGSAEAADTMIRTMFKFAAETPFEFTEVVDATRRLLAYGFAAKDVIPMITAIGNAAAGLATGGVGIERITLALGQMMAKGKVQGQELRQLGEAGIKVMDIMKMVADKYGVTLGQIISIQEQGKLKAQDFIDAFKKYSEIRFGDMMFAQGKTFTGALTTISDNVRMVIAQGFEPLFKKLSEGVVSFAQFTKTEDFSAWASTITGYVTGAMTVIQNLTEFIENNLIPIIIVLGTTITVAALPALLSIAAAAAPFVALGLAIAGVLLLVDQLTNGVKRAADEVAKLKISQQEIARALGESGDAYLATRQKLDELTVAIVVHKRYGGEMVTGTTAQKEELAKLRAEMDTYLNKLLEIQRVQDKQEKFGIKPEWRAGVAIELIVPDVKTFVQNFMGSLSEGLQGMRDKMQPVTDEMTAILKSVADNTQKTFGAMWEDVVSGSNLAGDAFKTFANDMADSLKIPTEEQISFYLKEINKGMGDLGGKAKSEITDKVVDAFKKWNGTIQDLPNLLKTLQGVLLDVRDAAKEAADTKRWTAMAQEMAKGIGGAFADAQKAFDKSKDVKIFSGIDFEEKRLEIRKLAAEIPQIELNILRMNGVAKDGFDWTQKPAPSVLEEWNVKLAKAKLDLQKTNEELSAMEGQNAKAATSGTTMWAEIDKALGTYFAHFVVAQEESGKITSQQADIMLGAYQRMFGTGLSDIEKFQLAFERASVQVLALKGPLEANEIALGNIAQAALKANDPVKTLNEGIKGWSTAVKDATTELSKFGTDGEAALNKIMLKAAESANPVAVMAQGVKDFKDQIVSVSGEGKAMDQLLLKTGEITQADIDMKKKSVEGIGSIKDTAIDSITELKNFELKLKDITEKTWNVVVQLIYTTPPGGGGGGGGAAHKEGDPIPGMPGFVWHKNPDGSWVPQLAGTGNLAAFEPRPIGIAVLGNMPASAASIIGQIQDILKLFSGLAIDPRLKEMSDIVGSVVSAFSDAMDALSKIANYTSPARDRVQQACNDFRYIIEQLVDFGLHFVGVTNWENFGKFADAASSIVSAFGDALDAIAKLKSYTSPAKSKVDQALNDVKYIIQKLVAFVDTLAGEGDEIRKGFGEAASSILGAFSSGLEALMKLKDYTSPTRRAIDLACSDLAYVILKLIGSFTWLASLADSDVLDKFGGAASSILSTFGAGVDALIKLKDYTSPARSVIDTVASDIAYIVDRLIVAFKRYSDTMDWAKVQGFGEAGQSLLQAFSSGFEALIKIADYVSPARSAIDAIIADLLYIADKLITVSKTYDEKVLKLAQTFAETVGAIADAIGSAADNMQKAVGFKKVPADAFGPLADAIERWVKGMVWMASKLSKEGLASAKTMAEAAGAIGDALDKVIEPMKKAAQFPQVPTGDFGPLADAIFRWVQGMAYLADKLKTAGWSLADAKTMADTVSAIGSALTSVLQAFENAGKFTTVSETTWDNIKSTIGRVIDFMVGLKWAYGDIVSNLKEFAGNLQAVVQPFGTVVDTISTLYKLISDQKGKYPDVETPLIWIQSAAESIIVHLAQMKQGDMAGKVAGLIDFSTALNTVLSPIQTMVSAISAIYELIDSTKGAFVDIDTAMTWVQSGIEDMIVHLAQMKGGGMAEAVANLIDFATDLEKVLAPMATMISITSSAIDLAIKLKDGQVSLVDAMAQIDDAAKWLVKVMRDWYLTLDLGAKDNDTGEYLLVGYADSLGKILAPMSTVISVTSGAIDLVEKLKDGQVSLTDAIAQMDVTARWLVKLARSWYLTLDIGAKDAKTGEYVLVQYAEALGAILSPMSTIISVASGAINLAKELKTGLVSLDIAIEQMDMVAHVLVDQMKSWFDQLDLGAKVEETGEYVLVLYADALSAILSPMSSVISVATGAIGLAELLKDGLVSLDVAIEQVDAVTHALVAQVLLWYQTLDLGAKDAETGEYLLAQYANALSNILSPMSSVISITSGAIDLSEKLKKGLISLDIAIEQIDMATHALVDQVKFWADELDLGDKDLETGKYKLVLYAEALSAILSPMSTVISVVSGTIDLAGKLTKGLVILDIAIEQMDTAAHALVEQVKFWYQELDLGAKDLDTGEYFLVQYAESLNAVLSPMSSVISITSGMIDLAAKLVDGQVDLSTSLTMMGDVALLLVERMKYWSTIVLSGMSDDAKEALIQFANDLNDILSPMASVISITSGMLDLQDKLTDGLVDIGTSLTMLGDVVRLMIQAMKYWQAHLDLGATEAERESFIQFAADLGAALSPISTAINVVSALIDLTEKLAEKQYNWDRVMGDLLIAMIAVIDAMQALATPEFKEKLKKFTEEFASGLQNAFGPIKTAIDALNAIKTYVGFAHNAAGDIPARIAMLAADIISFMQAFAEAARTVEISPELKEFGEALGAIIGPVKSYIDAFYWIWRYESIAKRSGGDAPQFTAIAEDMRLLMLTMYNMATKFETDFPGAVAKLKTFSEDLKPLFDVTKSAVDFFNWIADYGNQSKMASAKEFGPLFLEGVRALVASFNAAEGVIATLTAAMFNAGQLAGDALVDGIEQAVEAREPELIAMAIALGEAISAALIIGINGNNQNNAAAGEENNKGGNPNLASAGPTTVNITFTGDINASNPEDVQTLTDRIAAILGERAVSRKNVTTAAY